MIVVCLLTLGKIFYVRFPSYVAFIWALFLIVLAQPLAVFGASFWLSFSAVGVLLFYFLPRVSAAKNRVQILFSQWVLFSGMLAPLALFVGQFSWLGFGVNLIAVPMVSLITVPLCLLAAILFFLSPTLAELLWVWAGFSIDSLWFLFDLLPAEWGFYYFSVPSSILFFLSMACLSIAILLPRGLLTGWLLILPLALHIFGHKPRLPLRITLLDVGQGLSVVVESKSKLMVYDVGASFSDRFNMGSAVVAPFIMGRGIKRIDKLVISHGDNDHAGGLVGLAQLLPVEETLLTPGFFPKAFDGFLYQGQKSLCDATRNWTWLYVNSSVETEWIYFNILLPKLKQAAPIIKDSNNNSCVLLIRWRDISILLPGDIEKQAERLLLESYQLPPVDLLVAPHHGSKTSSGKNFVEH